MGVRLLCIGDIHLGRTIHIPAALSSSGSTGTLLDLDMLQPSRAWRTAVDRAIALDVDGVLLAGDVVDSDAHFYAAYAELANGIRSLAAKNIPVFAVAGNHDVEVLPRLADELPDLHLLGRGGEWEIAVICSRQPGNSGESIRILGWSFPGRIVQHSPLRSLPAYFERVGEPKPDIPIIGLLHCDLGAAGGYHAPVTRAELSQQQIAAWLLGHIHVPGSLDDDSPIGYLGSLVGLDPTETGWHGSWLLRSDAANSAVRLERLDTSPLIWRRVSVALDGCTDTAQVDSRLLAALRRIHAEYEGSSVSVVGCRLELSGRTSIHASLQSHIDKLLTGETSIYVGSAPVCFADDIRLVDVRPEVDILSLMSGIGPPASLAAMIHALECGHEEGRALISQARFRLQQQLDKANWSALPPLDLTNDVVQSYLLDSAYIALETLLNGNAAGDNAL